MGTSQPVALRVPSRHRLVRWLFIGLGSLLVGVGVLGIFLPLLPSTVFFLMAAACYGKSSPSAYHWLTTNRWFGSHLRDYKEERGATVGAKVMSIGSLWLGIGVTEVLIDNTWLRLTLLAVALGVSAHLMLLKTIRR
ncbi:MAG: YbaN family protein [Dehalococcoidia bacterium]|nr:YbaN family protein [Dehalococcoidia bacterium]MBK8560419.1 YbaN family protein [Dehalococcoidia bacterium]MBK9342950.1 YbaN family protein [Dehalococcoidia bacterium]MCC6267478.1 YbaN family protein [Dehalococcoidia bacterium]